MSQLPQPVAPFHSTGAYDVPGILLGQLLDGEAGWSSVRRTLLNPTQLSPTERDSLSDKIKLAVGSNNRITDTLINVISNPLTWVFFFTSAPGMVALKEGRDIFMPALRKSEFIKKYGGLLESMGLFTADESSHVTAHAMMRTGEIKSEFLRGNVHLREAARAQEALLQGLSTKFNTKVTSFDPTQYAHIPDLADEIKRIREATLHEMQVFSETRRDKIMEVGNTVRNTAQGEVTSPGELAELLTKQADLDKQSTELWNQVKFHNAKGDDSAALIAMQNAKWVDKQRELLGKNVNIPGAPEFVPGPVTSRLSDESAARPFIQANPEISAYAKAMKGFSDEIPFHLGFFEKDAQGAITFNANRARAFMRKLQGGHLTTEEAAIIDNTLGSRGKEAMRRLFSDDNIEAIQKGYITADELHWRQADAIWSSHFINDGYLPRNTFKPIKVEGGRTYAGHSDDDLVGPSLDSATASEMARTGKEATWHPDEIYGMFAVRPTTQANVEAVRKSAMERATTAAASPEARTLMGLSTDPFKVMQRYADRVGDSHALFAVAPDADVLKLMHKGLSAVEGGTSRRITLPSWVRGQDDRSINTMEDWTKTQGWEQHVTNHDVLHTLLINLENPHTKDFFKDVVYPHTMGKRAHMNPIVEAGVYRARQAAAEFAESKVGNYLEGSSTYGKRFVESLRKLGDTNLKVDPRNVESSLARLFYSAHLGLNPASMVLNLTQPFLSGVPMFGWQATLGAVADHVKEMGSYMADRIGKYGLRAISNEERAALTAKHYKFAKLAGLGDDYLHQLDSVVFTGKSNTSATRFDKWEEAMMKGFHLSEVSNRNISAHLMDRAIKASGQTLSEADHARYVSTWVKRTQYGSTPENTPRALMSGPLSSPLAKQFLTYPVRSLSMVLNTLPNMANPDSYGKGLLLTGLRGLGASAIVYEAAKGMFHANVSRGLYLDSATALIGGDRISDPGKQWIPLPPVVSVPVGFIQAIAAEDSRLLADSISRVIPGGVAVSRALQAAPEFGGVNPLAALQKTYTNWQQATPDGRVAVYKGDGSLVGFERPSTIVMKSLGLDFGAAGETGELDNYLAKQRDQISQYRQRLISQIAANDLRGAEVTAKEFGSRFKGPDKRPLQLTFTQAQVKAYLRSKEASRTERLLDRIPPEARPIFAQMVAATPGSTSSASPAAITGTPTSITRQRPNTLNLDPRALEELRRRMSVGPAAATANPTFGSF